MEDIEITVIRKLRCSESWFPCVMGLINSISYKTPFGRLTDVTAPFDNTREANSLVFFFLV
jgi:hypothetical protein